MNKLSEHAIRSMFNLLFESVLRFEIDKNRIHTIDPILLVERVYEEKIVKEIEYFLKDMLYLFDEPTKFKTHLDELKELIAEEVLQFKQINKRAELDKRLLSFVKELYGEKGVQFFKEAIHLASKKKEELEITRKKYIEGAQTVIEEVLKIYEEVDGDSEKLKKISCPICDYDTSNYYCNYYGNQHVHFYCESCDFNFMM